MNQQLFSESMKEWTDESMNRWFNESMNPWGSESVNPWVDESMNRWFIEATSQWIGGSVSESMNQWTMHGWTSESVNQELNDSVTGWVNESMNQEPRINDSMAQWMKGWMHDWVNWWMGELLFFVELLHWATFASLSYFFPGQPLIWATSALSFLPASFSVASAAQPPAAIPLAMSVAASLMLCCAAVPMRLSQLQPIDNFPRSRPATAETATLLRQPQEPHYPKITEIRARECFHPWIHGFPNCFTSQLLGDDSWCGWHDDVDDVVDMTMGLTLMMRLAWWCEC